MAYSHMRFIGRIADTLIDAGHDVLLIQPIENIFVRGSGSEKAPVYPIEISKEVHEEAEKLHLGEYISKLVWEHNLSPFTLKHGAEAWNPLLRLYVNDLMTNITMLEDLKSMKFDVGITELFDFAAFPIFYKIGLKTIIGAHSTTLMEGTAYAMAVPTIPSFIPPVVGLTGDSTSFWNRMKNVVMTYESMKASYLFAEPAVTYMAENFPEAPSCWDIVADIPLVFVNTVPTLDYPRPSLEHIVSIGGITMEKSKKLDKEWDDIMNLRQHTALFSFGSIFPPSTMSLEMKLNIIKIFGKMKNTTFIWKYDANEDMELFENTSNIIRTNWMPQNDILGDSRLSLFITHGGAGSLQESAYNGIPIIMIPLFGDQYRNAFVAESRGYALRLWKEDLSDERILTSALTEIIDNPKYKSAALRVQRQLHQVPMSPQEKLDLTIVRASTSAPAIAIAIPVLDASRLQQNASTSSSTSPSPPPPPPPQQSICSNDEQPYNSRYYKLRFSMPATVPIEIEHPIVPTMTSSLKEKRFSVPRQLPERKVTIRPYESFREKQESKILVTFGYAALSTEGNLADPQSTEEEISRKVSSPSIFSIYGDSPGPSTVCEQPIGAQADIFVSSLGEKTLHQIKRFIENSPPAENQYFMWIKDTKTNKITVISIKTLENHMKSDKRVRRVKWRHLSSEPNMALAVAAVCYSGTSLETEVPGPANIPQEFRTVVIVQKTTRWDWEQEKNPNFCLTQLSEYLRRRGEDVDKMLRTDRQQKKAVDEIANRFKQNGVEAKIVSRHELSSWLSWADLVISAGGDGTFLSAAAAIKNEQIPIIGINTDPRGSEGHFCVDGKHPPHDLIERLMNGKFQWTHRSRIRVTLLNRKHEGDNKCILALNEVFVAEDEAARVSSYDLAIDDQPLMRQKSSGLIVSTGSGSTSWYMATNRVEDQTVSTILETMQSMGINIPGVRQKLSQEISKRINSKIPFDPQTPNFAYCVRDPIFNETFKKTAVRGFARKIFLKSRCHKGFLVLDGSEKIPFDSGAEVLLEIFPTDSIRTITSMNSL
ncbi:unnamed protein product [Auanema sp. JU1783]|nr:unnamed protein product [Auanema sp. JU1783]